MAPSTAARRSRRSARSGSRNGMPACLILLLARTSRWPMVRARPETPRRSWRHRSPGWSAGSSGPGCPDRSPDGRKQTSGAAGRRESAPRSRPRPPAPRASIARASIARALIANVRPRPHGCAAAATHRSACGAPPPSATPPDYPGCRSPANPPGRPRKPPTRRPRRPRHRGCAPPERRPACRSCGVRPLRRLARRAGRFPAASRLTLHFPKRADLDRP